MGTRVTESDGGGAFQDPHAPCVDKGRGAGQGVSSGARPMQKGAEPGRSTKKRKVFTVESANRTLPLVRSIVTDIVQKFRELHDLHGRLEVLQGSRRDALTTAHREEVEEVERDFERDFE